MMYITKTQKSLLAAAVLVLVIISGTIYIRQESATEINLGEAIELDEPAGSAPAAEEAEPESKEIYVHICGSVKNPGVFKVVEGTRLAEAVEMAGGANEDADLSAVNLAYKLEDEDMIYIPKIGEEPKDTAQTVPGVKTVKGVNVKDRGKVNINTAGKSELEALNGIGPATAEAIIRYREEAGPFGSIEDIKNVTGIGEGRFDKIKNDITVD